MPVRIGDRERAGEPKAYREDPSNSMDRVEFHGITGFLIGNMFAGRKHVSD